MTQATLTREARDSADVIALLTEQCQLFRQLGELATGQRDLITGDSPEQLLGVLGERQRLIERLEALAGRLRPYQDHWQTLRPAMTPSDQRRADQLVSEVNVLLRSIIEKDAADAQLLAARKSVVAQAVQATKAARRAGAAYGAGQSANGSRIDWMDE